MKYIWQFGIILLVSFIGEVLNYYIPLPIPASIYGLVLMFTGLKTGIIKYEYVKDAGHFLIEIMPLMFIPSAVGLMVSWNVLKPVVLPITVITVVSTVLVMAVTGKVSDVIIRHSHIKEGRLWTSYLEILLILAWL